MTEIFAEIPCFEFNADLAGVDSFVMIAGGGDELLNPRPRGLDRHLHPRDVPLLPANTLPGDVWRPGRGKLCLHRRQPGTGYAGRTDARGSRYADDATARETAVRRFAAICLVRCQAAPRVALDNDQERFGGRARYLEHRLAGGDTRFTYHGGNYDIDLLGDPDAVREFGESVKGY